MWRLDTVVLVVIILSSVLFPYNSVSAQYTYKWDADFTYEGSDSVNMVQPVQVMFLDEPVWVVPHSASLHLMQRYSVLLGLEWTAGQAYRLLQTFESVPQQKNRNYDEKPRVPLSLWQLTSQHIQNDIEISETGGQKTILLSLEAFTYAEPLLAKIEGVRGRFFSKRLHRAVVRYATDNGQDRQALAQILEDRYAVTLNVPDYAELTKNTTKENAGRFGEFKNEELMALVSMLEEYPQGMHKTPGLRYLVRRLDGTPHPINPIAPAIAWVTEGYIEFMESAFKEQGLDYIHRLILHEKAHFLWAHLFDNQLKQDWIELGGWYVDPNDKDGWSTTKQTEFVSAYAHAKNPNEDMAESISYYIVNPDKLRSRAPEKYEFIQNRVMHGTRYISRIRADLTFEVYNLYPDVVYPGRIIRVDIQVRGEPEEDKEVTIELEIHGESEFDTVTESLLRIFSAKGTFFDIWLFPIDSNGQRMPRRSTSHILQGRKTLSKYVHHGYWRPDKITLRDAQGNERHESQRDYGWKLYINNPLADDTPPEYVKGSMQLSLSQSEENGRPFHIITARWMIFEQVGMNRDGANVYVRLNDASRATYSINADRYGTYNPETSEATVRVKIPDYYPSGKYKLNYIYMIDRALNRIHVYFTEPGDRVREDQKLADELPPVIEVQTTNPDTIPPVVDLNQITLKAEPTHPQAPNGETRVDITFRVKDNISGYLSAYMYLRDPHGTVKEHRHYVPSPNYSSVYYSGDPTEYQTYIKTVVLPVGSIPGTWGLAQMLVRDKGQNKIRLDFTEIIRFEVSEKWDGFRADFDGDGRIAFEDFLFFVAAFGIQSGQDGFDPKYDLDNDGTVGFSDFLIFVDIYSIYTQQGT